jgi:hypothetical protein
MSLCSIVHRYLQGFEEGELQDYSRRRSIGVPHSSGVGRAVRDMEIDAATQLAIRSLEEKAESQVAMDNPEQETRRIGISHQKNPKSRSEVD